jgi:8-oxo-dGTP pyrophosphatase MutT (NUDIX family)
MPISSGPVRQAAAIPLRGEQVCLVTSRSGKRWVIPKGCLEPGMTAGEIALQEAWEEAGLSGVLRQEPVGSYVYEKSGLIYHVTVFFMEVTHAARDWPERSSRDRRWVSPELAVERIEDHGLRELIRGVAPVKIG